MNKYLRIFLAEFTIASKRYLETRAGTFGGVTINLLSLFVLIVFIEVYFMSAESVMGWSKYQVIFLAGVYRFSESLWSLFFIRSVNWIPNYVKNGDLDYFLIKPVNSQFFITFRLTRVYEILNTFSGLLVMNYALSNMNQSFNAFNWLLLLLGVLFGGLILYGIYFSLSTLSIWMGKFDSFADTYSLLTEPLRAPIDILGKNASFVLTFIIPLGFIITIPVKIFLSMEHQTILIVAFILSVVSVFSSILFWNLALKHYTSASS